MYDKIHATSCNTYGTTLFLTMGSCVLKIKCALHVISMNQVNHNINNSIEAVFNITFYLSIVSFV